MLTRTDLKVGLGFLALVILSHINFIFHDKSVSPDASYILMSLETIRGPIEYFYRLFSFQNLDILPLRDLTFYFDMWVYEQFRINTFIFLNCLLWAGACFHIHNLVSLEFPGINSRSIKLAVATLCVHPVISQLINWSMARKHLLAIFFISWATCQFLRWLKGIDSRPWFILHYFLSLLSVPLSLLWPVWAAIIWYRNDARKSEDKKIFACLFALMITIGLANIAYYSLSTVILEIFPAKKMNVDLFLIVIHLGILFRQILFPYELSLSYNYSDYLLIPLLVMSLFLGWILFKKEHRKAAWSWILFWALHSVLFLKTPEFFADTYAAIPVISFFIILISLFSRQLKKFDLFLVPIILFWTAFTLFHNPIWATQIAFNGNNFEKSPSCLTARALAKSYYLDHKKIPNELYEYLQVQQCFAVRDNDSPSMIRGLRNLESLQLLFEDEIDPEFRKSRLLELANDHYYPMIIYSTLMAQENNDEEVELMMGKLNKLFENSPAQLDYDEIYSDKLASYCLRKDLTQCKTFMNRWKPKKERPFL